MDLCKVRDGMHEATGLSSSEMKRQPRADDVRPSFRENNCTGK